MKFNRNVVISLGFLAFAALSACTATQVPALPASPTPLLPTPTNLPATLTAAATLTPTGLPNTPGSPSLSPIAAVFVAADNNVYAWADGNTSFVKITDSNDALSASISSDGQLVAYSRTSDGNSYSLDIVYSDGSNSSTLFTPEDFLGIARPATATSAKPYKFAWKPNSHLMVMTMDYEMEGPGLVIAPEMILFDVDNGTHQTLFLENEPYQFFFSPDGSKIALALPDGIDLFDSNGNPLFSSRFYSFAAVNTASEAPFLPKIVWSSDSARFAFVIPPPEPFNEQPGLTQVIEIDSATGKATNRLTASMAFQMPQEISQDLAQIVYLQPASSSSAYFDLHIASLSGGVDEVVAANTSATDFSWSPDSTHFIYSLASGSILQAYIGEIHADPVQIKQVSDARALAWIDADRYLVPDKTAGGWKIWLGAIGAVPELVYSDNLTSGIGLSFSTNR